MHIADIDIESNERSDTLAAALYANVSMAFATLRGDLPGSAYGLNRDPAAITTEVRHCTFVSNKPRRHEGRPTSKR